MKRDFNIPTSELSSYNNNLTNALNDSSFRSKIGCPTPVNAGSLSEVENSQYTTGVPITKTFGACLNLDYIKVRMVVVLINFGWLKMDKCLN